MTHKQMLQKVQKDTQKWLIIGFGGVVSLTKEQLQLKYNLIRDLLIEEYSEYLDGIKKNNRLEQLNAISDLLFVANNLPFYEGKHKVEDWVITDKKLQFYNPRAVFEHYYHDYELVLEVINTIISESGFSIYEIYMENEATYKSNMTKFCKTEAEAKVSAQMYANGTHPNMQDKKEKVVKCEYLPTGNSEYPFRVQTPDGKIMKSHLFLDVEHFRN